jgi:hypothetical protein
MGYLHAFRGGGDEAEDEAGSAMPDISSSVIASWLASFVILLVEYITVNCEE